MANRIAGATVAAEGAFVTGVVWATLVVATARPEIPPSVSMPRASVAKSSTNVFKFNLQLRRFPFSMRTKTAGFIVARQEAFAIGVVGAMPAASQASMLIQWNVGQRMPPLGPITCAPPSSPTCHRPRPRTSAARCPFEVPRPLPTPCTMPSFGVTSCHTRTVKDAKSSTDSGACGLALKAKLSACSSTMVAFQVPHKEPS
mmetsp:Transcript_7992/g.9936  ORF Transcript_7992/g.9936 Transcript_7992/m.9936 type:complete len:201 (+) Transcript_7992:35-637(+)